MAFTFCCAAVLFLVALMLAVVQVQTLLAIIDDTIDPEFVVVPNEPKSLDECHFRYYEHGKQSSMSTSFGVPAYQREFAHIAAIGWTQPDNTVIWNCGGTLISEQFVLTAAYCSALIRPDVVRLGDINLSDDSDDKDVQQIGIVDIIYPPNHNFTRDYHDIALLQLERNVVLHDTVAPACLWNKNETRFKTLEATGWRYIAQANELTPKLAKMTMARVDKEKCEECHNDKQRLPYGLDDNQICYGNDEQATCEDSRGNPLQVKLLHNTRITPFVVAVTSFGMMCGMGKPGVYVRVAPYIHWIQSVLIARGVADPDRILKSQACARKYVNLREYEPRVQLSKNSVQEQLDLTNAHLSTQPSRQIVQIHWNRQMANSSNECYGVIIDESTVLTLARCTRADSSRKSPTHVTFAGNKTNTITHTYKHPNYDAVSLRNAIGVLKVKDAFEFNADFTPACVWTKQSFLEPEMEVTGRGLQELNKLFIEPAPEIARISLSNTVDVLGIVMEQKGTNCSLNSSNMNKVRLTNGLTQEHVCFGAKPFLVPKTCSQTIGGPLQREVDRYGRILVYVNALNLVGKDCGFGESALAIRLAHHKRWLEKILYPTKKTAVRKTTQQLKLLWNELEEGDSCTALSSYENDESCESRIPLTSHVVSIVWQYDKEEHVCIGTIIANRTVLTAASCVDTSNHPSHVAVADASGHLRSIAAVDKILIHPTFNNSTMEHNLAVVSAEDIIVKEGFEKSRACLWRNVTHTPFMMEQLVLADNNLETIPAHLKFNADCRRALGRILTSSELCLKVEDLNESPVSIDDGMPVFWPKPDGGYLVGIVSRRSSLSDRTIVQYTRISSYVDWIKAVLRTFE
uniref:Peptidase S1 domain-containing protein n=1 Tax=Anopheles albimanus TaxID=7167 RepID=A0A8W7JB97_ANOAL